jgi:hypothetical protein
MFIKLVDAVSVEITGNARKGINQGVCAWENSIPLSPCKIF